MRRHPVPGPGPRGSPESAPLFPDLARHHASPAATAIATLHAESGGRAVPGIGINHFFITIAQAGCMPEAMVGVRRRQLGGRARTPRITWTKARMSVTLR